MDEQKQEVTKVKNPGRIQAGKRLVEWNRKNKENLTKNLKQEPDQDSSSQNQVNLSTSTSAVKSYDAHMYGVGILTILAIGCIVLYYKYPRSSAEKNKVQKSTRNDDIFKMN